MKQKSLPLFRSQPSAAARIAAGVVLGGCVAIMGQILTRLVSTNSATAPWPFGSSDVAIVYFLSALPIAAAGAWLGRTIPAGAAVTLSALVLSFGAALLQVPFLPVSLLGFVLRTAISLSLILSAAVSLHIVYGNRPFWRRLSAQGYGWFGAGVAASLFLLAPATYVGARCRHDRGKLAEYLQSSRYGDAQRVATRLLIFDAGQSFNNHRLTAVAAEVASAVAALELQVARPLPEAALAGERLTLARTLAMLGRTAEALGTIAPLEGSPVAAEADNLRGTIHESQRNWNQALVAYDQARAAWQRKSPGEERTAGLIAATRGVAYCLRKGGRYADAEEEYQQLLALTPTAETHFLLAQFYEDSQHVGMARQHALKAAELAPDRYREPADQLLRKLSVFHFGCLRAAP
jgi:tetratricopeptide (TPR) repeat protein